MIRRLTLVAGAVLLSACSAGTGSGQPSLPPDEMPTASYSPPAQARTTPPDRITLNNVQPDDGIGPVVDFVRSARKSVDISIYRIDSDYTAIVRPLTRIAAAGIPVRISISRQLVGMDNPPDGNASQLKDAKALRAKGLQVELSRPEFHYGHEKAIVVDAGTPRARAMIADWNLQASYFGPNQYGPVGARGMAVVDTDPADVATIAAYFDANWPPYQRWPVSERASLVWSPSGIEFTPVGNGVAALTDFIDGAKKTLDVYAEYVQDDSLVLPMILDRARAGVTVRVVGNSSGQSPAVTDQLRAAGVQVRFDPTNRNQAPRSTMFVHSKSMVAEAGTPAARAFVGSQNQFINESLESILELGALVEDPATVARIHRIFDTDYRRSTPTQAPPSPSATPSPSSSPSPSTS